MKYRNKCENIEKKKGQSGCVKLPELREKRLYQSVFSHIPAALVVYTHKKN